jgi:ribosome-associated protein
VLIVNEQIQIPEDELDFTFVRSGGPGGQAVNKVNSKAQLRWNFAQSRAFLPFALRDRFLARYGGRLTAEGDLVISSDRHRDRLQNRQDCLDKLREILLSVAVAPKPRKKTKPGRGARERAKASKQRQGAKKRERSGRNWD